MDLPRPDKLARGYQRTVLFVKSKGCLNSGKPQDEQAYYKVSDFWLKSDNNPQATTNARLEIVSKQEKEKVLAEAIKDAQKENAYLTNFGTSSNGLIPTTAQLCLNLEEWKKTRDVSRMNFSVF